MKSAFSISLHLSDFNKVRALPILYDESIDDIRSILSDFCEIIEKEGQFIVSGFGQDRWPTDMGTDLAIFLEQLPKVLQAVRAGADAEIDFYEQGIERKIALSPDGEHYTARCISHTEWQPAPSLERICRKTLEEMLLSVQVQTLELMSIIAPHLSQDEWVHEWLHGNR